MKTNKVNTQSKRRLTVTVAAKLNKIVQCDDCLIRKTTTKRTSAHNNTK